jgi:hypothetical protein
LALIDPAVLVSFIGVVWKTYSIPTDWTVGHELLRHTLGAVSLILVLMPSSMDSSFSEDAHRLAHLGRSRVF